MSGSAKVSDVYQDRVALFIDILGLSGGVMAIDVNPALFLTVDAVLRHAPTLAGASHVSIERGPTAGPPMKPARRRNLSAVLKNLAPMMPASLNTPSLVFSVRGSICEHL